VRPVTASAQVSEDDLPEDFDSYVRVMNAREKRRA
jgi:hypothetical protein